MNISFLWLLILAFGLYSKSQTAKYSFIEIEGAKETKLGGNLDNLEYIFDKNGDYALRFLRILNFFHKSCLL